MHNLSFMTQSFFTDEEISILKKFKLYVEDNWNKCDMVAILLFVVGVSCRYLKKISFNNSMEALDLTVQHVNDLVKYQRRRWGKTE